MYRIFVIDDDPAICTLLHHIYRDQFEVHTFTNVRDALNTLDRVVPHVIVTDIMFPYGESGYDIVRYLQTQPPLRQVLVIALSAHNVVSNVLGEGCHGFLRKPFDANEVLDYTFELISLFKPSPLPNKLPSAG